MARATLITLSAALALALWLLTGCASSTHMVSRHAPPIDNDALGWVFVKAAVYDSVLISHHYEPFTAWRATIVWYSGTIPLTLVSKGGHLCYMTRAKAIAEAGHLVASDLVPTDCHDYLQATADLNKAVYEWGEAEPLEQAFR